MLNKSLFFFVPKSLKNSLVNFIPNCLPFNKRIRKRTAFSYSDRSVQGYPAHYLRVQKFLLSLPYFPNTVIRFFPMSDHKLYLSLYFLPQFIGNGAAVLIIQVNCVNKLTVNIQLKLLMCRITNFYGAGVPVPREIA